MNKKLLCLCALSLLLTGCGEVAKLNITTTEPITIDATEKLDPTVYLKDLDKNATVDYKLKDNELIISVTKGDKTTDFNVPVQVNEPNVSVDRHIEVDKYVGYDLEQYIHEDEGVTHTTNFDEDTGKLSVTFTKGEWTKVIDDDVTVLDSNPINSWPKKYSCTESLYPGEIDTYILYEDGKLTTIIGGGQDNGTYTYDGNNSFTFIGSDGYTTHAKGNYEHFEDHAATVVSGAKLMVICDLIKE